MSGTYPFLIKSHEKLSIDLTDVSIHRDFEEISTMAFGMKTGEIYIFTLEEILDNGEKEVKLKPRLLLLGSYNGNCGEVTAITFAKTPFNNISVSFFASKHKDSGENCLVSVHADGKIRIWDLEDGKCLISSRSGKFENPLAIKGFDPIMEHRMRFLYAIEENCSFYLIDLWNMKTHQLDTPKLFKYKGIISTRSGQLLVLDEDERILNFEFSGLNNQSFYDYGHYVQCPEEMMQIVESHKKLTVQVFYLPIRANQRKVTEDNIELMDTRHSPIACFKEGAFLIVLYKKKLVCYQIEEYLGLDQEVGFDQMIRTRMDMKFIEIELYLESECYSFIQLKAGAILIQRNGNCNFVTFEDIFTIFHAIKKEGEIYLVSEFFKIDKMDGTENTYARLKPSVVTIEGAKPIRGQTELSKFNNWIISSNIDYSSLEFYELDESKFNRSSVFEADPIKKVKLIPQDMRGPLITIKGPINTIITSKQTNPLNVIQSIYTILNHQIHRFITFEDLQELFKDIICESEIVATSLSGALSDQNLYYILGTTTGHLVIFPLFLYDNSKELAFYYYNIDIYGLKKIELIAGKILCCSEEGTLSVIDFDEAAGHESLISRSLRNGYGMSISKINSHRVGTISLNASIKNLLPIVINGENKKDMFKKFFSETIGIVLESNQLVLAQLNTKIKIFEHCYNEEGIVGLFFDSNHEFLYILYEDGNVDIFNANVGNVIAMMKTRNQFLELVDPEVVDREDHDVLFQLQFFINSCFSFERTVNLRRHTLNLHNLLEQYRNCYIDFKSYSKFCSSVLINLTKAGEVVEYATQFFTNPLLSSHIELVSFSAAQEMAIPHSLTDKKNGLNSPRKSPSKKQKKTLDAFDGNWDNFNNLEDLSKAIERANYEKGEAGAQMPFEEEIETAKMLDQNNIPLMIQNCVERDKFSLARERLGVQPLRMLKEFEYEKIFRNEDIDDLIKSIITLNYAGREIIVDCTSHSSNIMVNLKIGGYSSNAILISPPNFTQESKDFKLLLTSLVFPYGLDSESDESINKAFSRHRVVADIIPGIQGIGETLSFMINEDILSIVSCKNKNDQQVCHISKSKEHLLNAQLYGLSQFHSSYFMLGLVCEMIFLFKKGFWEVQELKNALRKVYFQLLPEVPGNKALSFKLLSWLILNDRLLLSAGAHFIINNIYSRTVDKEIFHIDKSTIDFCSQFFLTAQDKSMLTQKSAQGSPLEQISKLELFSTSLIMVELQSENGGDILNENMVSFSQALIVKLISKSIEVKVCSCYPFLVMPLIKICLESLNHIEIRSQARIFRTLIKNLTSISLYYGLTYEKREDHIFDSSLLNEEDLKKDKSLNSLVGKLKHQSYDVRRGIRIHVMKLIKILGEIDMEYLLNILREDVKVNDLSKLTAINTYDFLNYIMRNCGKALSEHLITWVEILMLCLDPNKPDIRKFCHTMASSLLSSLLNRYSFLASHKESQHFFIPNSANDIVVYDLKTAMKWKTLKGHSTKIMCISVDQTGSFLASFSSQDKNFKVWKISSSGFFENLIRRSAEQYKSVKIPFDIPYDSNHRLELTWVGKKKVKFSIKNVDWEMPFSF